MGNQALADVLAERGLGYAKVVARHRDTSYTHFRLWVESLRNGCNDASALRLGKGYAACAYTVGEVLGELDEYQPCLGVHTVCFNIFFVSRCKPLPEPSYGGKQAG